MSLSRREFFTQTAGALALAAVQRVNRADSPPALNCLFQGDSITDGNRGRNTDPNHIMGHGYAFSVASRIGADFPEAGHYFFNRGISGNTVSDLVARWKTDALDLHPNLLSVLIGINDAHAAVEGRSNASGIADFEKMYRQLLDQMLAQSPDTLLVLGIPFVYPVGDRKNAWASWNEQTRARAEVVQRLATDYHALLVDYPAVFDKAIKRAPVEYWIWDGIHPTVAGHELMARAWIRQVSERISFLRYYHYR